jgi:uncharacterized protein DUF5916/cellulose/xylan binding protein with CBM9 domain
MPILPAVLALAPHIQALRAADPLDLDGRLDEAAWSRAEASADFTQKRPREGAPPSERTELRVLYDDDAVYVGIDCEQRHAPVTARLSRRDRAVEADWVSVALDTRGDGRGAFELAVNAAGVLRDALRYNDTEIAEDWDEIWEAAVHRRRDGWSVELRIPLRILRFPRQPMASWGLEVRRHIAARHETDEWAFIPRSVAGEVSHYGKLDGVAALEERQSIELRPFVLAKIGRPDPEMVDVPAGARAAASAGLDAKWHPSQEVTVDLALNPDFGQVEADQVVLNLTNFEIFFPEKRPFFLEGVDTFATPLGLLYTRRIGRAPDDLALGEGELLAGVPAPAPIYGAVKAVGDAGAFRFGALSAVTGAEHVPVETGAGEADERLALPLTAVQVLRASGAIGAGAMLGALATASTRFEPAGAYPRFVTTDGSVRQRCPAGEEVAPGERCFHDAYAAGIDGLWRSETGDWVVAGQLVGTLIEHGPSRIQPDGTVIASGDLAPAGFARVAKEGGEHWVGELLYDGHADRVDYNALGFMERQNQHHFAGEIGYRTLAPSGMIRETVSKIEIFDRETTDFLNLARGYQINTAGELRNFWRYFVELHYRAAHFDDREVGDGTALERAGLVGLEIEGSTDPRAPAVVELATQAQYLWDGVVFRGEGKLTVHALPDLDLELAPDVVYTSGEPRFVDLAAGAYRFGRLRATSLGITLRATYTFTPAMTLQAYAQAFVAAGDYSEFLAYPRDPAAHAPVIALADLAPTGIPEANPDFEAAALDINLVWRWEYLPGSLLYLVYTHAQDTESTPAAARARLGFGGLAPRLGADVLLVKLSYWWAS